MIANVSHLLGDNVPFLTRHDLPGYEPTDAVQWNVTGLPKDGPSATPPPSRIFNVSVVVWKPPRAVAGGPATGAFKDGPPDVVTKTHRKVRAALLGFLPGPAALKSALPVRPVERGASKDRSAQYLPNGMSGHLRARLVDAFRGRGATAAGPVVASDGLVEALVTGGGPGQRLWCRGSTGRNCRIRR